MVDFTDALVKALALLAQMEEFSQSRYRLESRYQHVLVDELQDTSRPQWQLVELLVQAWGAGAGVSHDGPTPPSIFVVGDRKQSIYGFRDADVGVLDAAARLIGRLRPGREPRRAIVKSFRAVPALQRFVNDVCDEIGKRTDRVDAFRYNDLDRFPVPHDDARARPVGLVAAPQTAGGGQGRGRRNRAAARHQGRRARPRHRHRARRAAGRHRHSLPLPRQPPRVRARAGAGGRALLRLQGPRLLRRRRGEGRDRAHPLPGRARHRSARRGVPAFALRAPVRSGPQGAGAAAGVGLAVARAAARRWPRSATEDQRRAGHDAPVGGRLDCAGRPVAAGRAGRRRAARERLLLRDSRPRPRPGPREPEEAARAHPPAAESRLRHARVAWPSACRS